MNEIELSRDDLNDELQVVADKIGVKNTETLLETFGGTSVYFPKIQHRNSAARRYIRDNLGRESISKMARNTGLSQRSIFNYLNSKSRRRYP
jgi:Mor family transcriptional regulator